MVKITSKATRNPNMFALTGDNNVTHLLKGNTKLSGIGMTVEEYHNSQLRDIMTEETPNEEDNEQP